MAASLVLQHEFVEHIPEVLHNGFLYVSIRYATAAHKCCCGCGNEVITPLSPTDWKLVFDGKTVSLYPSIGNWALSCKSHYWIDKNRVRWAKKWTDSEIEKNRQFDRLLKGQYYRNAK